MELKLEPSILKVLIGANSKLQFLGDCLNYCGEERPTAAILLRRLNQLTSEGEYTLLNKQPRLSIIK